MTATKAIATCLAIYAIYLPAAWLVHRDYVLPPKPAGFPVEKLGAFLYDKPDHFVTRLLAFRSADFPDTAEISVYENMTPLRREHVEFTLEAGTYIIRFKTTDGSDARFNGRRYWAVGARHD